MELEDKRKEVEQEAKLEKKTKGEFEKLGEKLKSFTENKDLDKF